MKTRAEYQRVYYGRHKEEIEARRKVLYDIKRDLVLSHYGSKCVCCGEDKKSFLALDHVNNDGHKDRTSGGNRVLGLALYQRLIKQNFPNTFQILCYNCNISKFRNGGVCEHNLHNA